MLLTKKELNFVVVGANDGMINDPSYEIIMGNRGRTSVLLVEPNPDLIPYLTENYSQHPSCVIANYAIGREGDVDLYVVKKSWWGKFQPSYAKGWPEYRAPTGITSGSRDIVAQALSEEGVHADEAIEAITVKFTSLAKLCAELNWRKPIDVMQVDAEGYDDEVIYHSDVGVCSPRVILFENLNFDNTRRVALHEYLLRGGYCVCDIGMNSLAISRVGFGVRWVVLSYIAVRKVKALLRGWGSGGFSVRSER